MVRNSQRRLPGKPSKGVIPRKFKDEEDAGPNPVVPGIGQVVQTVTPMPTETDLLRMTPAKGGEYDLTDKETQRLRRKIYGLNRELKGVWRTMREGRLLLVWRIR